MLQFQTANMIQANLAEWITKQIVVAFAAIFPYRAIIRTRKVNVAVVRYSFLIARGFSAEKFDSAIAEKRNLVGSLPDWMGLFASCFQLQEVVIAAVCLSRGCCCSRFNYLISKVDSKNDCGTITSGFQGEAIAIISVIRLRFVVSHVAFVRRTAC